MIDKEVSAYIESFEGNTKAKLVQLRALIHELIPHAEEKMAYGIPTYKLGKNIVHFGGFQKHIGFYPEPDTISHFKDELKDYSTSKGAVNFDLHQELPIELIKSMINYRINRMKQK